MTRTEAIEKAIARYVSRGGNANDGRQILAEELEPWMPVDLVARVLTHWNFATRATAPSMAAALKAA